MSAAHSQPLPQFYTWGFSGAPIQVVLSLEVVSGIRKQIEESENAPGGPSGCGLLIGDTSSPGITRILGFESLASLDAASVGPVTGSASEQVAGFYRTIPSGNVSMLDEDRALATSSFSHPNCVFLLIETGNSKVGDARFCFWGEGGLFDFPLMIFPFDAGELAIMEWRRRSSVRAASPASQAGPTPVTSGAEEWLDDVSEVVPDTGSAEPETDSALGPSPVSPAGRHQKSTAVAPAQQQRQGKGWRRLALLLLVLLTAGAAVGTFLYSRRSSTPPVAPPAPTERAEVKPPPLGLAVEKRGSSLVVSWNGNAPVMSQANFGMLLIRGTELSRDVPLTADELRAGSVVFATPVDQVRFQLNVVASDQVTRESIIFIQSRPAETRASVPVPQRSSPPAGEPSVPVLNTAAPPQALRPFKPAEKAAPSTASITHIEEPPVVSGAVPVNNGAPALLNSPAVSLPAPAPAATVPANAVPPKESLLSAEAHAPVATYKVIPTLPPLLKGRLWIATVVDVKVSVDAVGNVVRAEVVGNPALHQMLRDASLSAAQKWKFQPAQFNGHAVPADTVVQFNFAASR